ncbi:MAG: VWA domain-containing protein, partial [Candidatus Riflebacteria bacterium]|nr:VWA domain-containing protein [Candidatus Riflebacteria bacterium]
MRKHFFLALFILLLAVTQTAFAFEYNKTTEKDEGFIPYSRYLEKLLPEDYSVFPKMTDEQKAEANEEIDKLLASAKGNFDGDFELSEENYRITIYEGFSPLTFEIPNAFVKSYEFDDNALDIAWLDDTLTKSGAKRYRTTGADLVYFIKTGNDRQCFVTIDNKSCLTINFICSYVIPNNTTLSLTAEDFENKDKSFGFAMNSLPGKSQIAKISIKGDEGAKVYFFYSSVDEYENHKEVFNKEIELETKKSFEFTLDSLPSVDGQLYILVAKDGEIESVTIKFETIDRPAVKYGSELGMLVLKGVDPMLGAELMPYCESDEFSNILRNPVVDDTGSFVFVAPAGYYKLLFGKNPYLQDIEGKCFAQNIPVSAGEATEIIIPKENLRTINELRKLYVVADENKSDGNIQLTNLTVNGEKGVIELIINDPLERDVFPEEKDIKVQANGVEGTVTKIEREPQPVDVVLVLDSSGSMGENMKPAVESAKTFVNSLPDSTNIRFIQFAQKITIHKGEKKADIVKALDTVKSIGATAMYDALDKALKLLENKKKPYIVLFSDGADSREPGIDGKGSDLTKEQIISKLGKSKATLLAIGFGKGHDPKTLKAMSEVTPNGMYVAAADKKGLPAAFAAVSSKFGNQFKISYDRPYTSIDAKSDVPVIAM